MMARTLFAGLVGLAVAAQLPRFEPVQPELFAAGGTFVNAWADYDGDGDLDQFVGFDGKPNRLYRNDKGRFTNATDGAGLSVAAGAVRQPAWIDADGDGDLDLFVAFRDKANALFRNDSGKFTDIAADVGLADARKTVGAVWFDVDEDGDLDVAVANMDGDANGLYRNDGGKFVDIAAEPAAGGLQWGGRTPNDKTNGTVRTCAADVDLDGRLDLFMANYGKNGLFLNKGKGQFENVSAAWGVDIDARYDTCIFGDMDNDGYVDLYINGTVTGGVSYRDYLFRNTGTRFQDVTSEELKALQADHGASWVDFDRDGDLDLSLTGAQATGMHLLLRNPLPAAVAARSLQIRVADDRGRRLPGATVLVFAAGSTRLVATGLVDGGSGYDAQNDMPVHVGLPSLDPVDIRVTVKRATSMASQLFPKIDPRQFKGRAYELRLPIK
jgi:hypothetical protein